jgi:SAM-dependent methyltransferase
MTLCASGTDDQATTTTRCPLCGQDDCWRRFSVNRHGPFDVCWCRHCRFAFASPRPTPEQLSAFYRSTYFNRASDQKVGYTDYRGLPEMNARRNWHRFAGSLAARSAARRLILDVGCATGGFLSEARSSGWTGVGLELSAEATAVASSEFGLEVLHGDLRSGDLDGRRFGVVTMWHVLEHVIDPLDDLKCAARLLDPGGILFIELPNWNSLGRVARGPAWSALTPPEHINFFTPASLRKAAVASGFEVLACDTHYPSLMDRARVRRGTQPLHMVVAGIGVVASRLGAGGYLRLTARKPA